MPSLRTNQGTSPLQNQTARLRHCKSAAIPTGKASLRDQNPNSVLTNSIVPNSLVISRNRKCDESCKGHPAPLTNQQSSTHDLYVGKSPAAQMAICELPEVKSIMEEKQGEDPPSKALQAQAAMCAGQLSSQPAVDPIRRLSHYKCAILAVGLTLVVSLVAILFIRPHVGPWLAVRSAYRNLSSLDYDARINAISLLRRLGEKTESKLIALLHHPNEGVRNFAASELAHRSRVTDDIIEAFLIALENNQHITEIGHSAPKLFFSHAKASTGPLTKTDRRMITWLTSELNSGNPDRSGTAAWALTAFINRDPSLREPLAAYLKNGAFFYKYIVLREMADIDPAMQDEYVDVLLSGLESSVYTDQLNAQYGLANLKNPPDGLRSRFEERRRKLTDPGEISRIDER